MIAGPTPVSSKNAGAAIAVSLVTAAAKGGQMADVAANTPVFSRGSTVLDYWLVHAEGLTVQPLGARVEHVVVVAPLGHAESLIVRSRMTRRRRSIPAGSIAAVEPSAGRLLLDTVDPGARTRTRLPRPSTERIAAARAGAVRGGRRARASTLSTLSWLRPRAVRAASATVHYNRALATQTVRGGRIAQAGTLSVLAWLRPRVVQTAATSARHARAASARTARGIGWLAPRIAEGARVAGVTTARLTLAGAVLVARLARSATARAARGLAERRPPRAPRAQLPGPESPDRSNRMP